MNATPQQVTEVDRVNRQFAQGQFINETAKAAQVTGSTLLLGLEERRTQK